MLAWPDLVPGSGRPAGGSPHSHGASKAGRKHGAPPALSSQPERSPGLISPDPAKPGHGQSCSSCVRRHRCRQTSARDPRAPFRRELHDRPWRGGGGDAPSRCPAGDTAAAAARDAGRRAQPPPGGPLSLVRFPPRLSTARGMARWKAQGCSPRVRTGSPAARADGHAAAASGRTMPKLLTGRMRRARELRDAGLLLVARHGLASRQGGAPATEVVLDPFRVRLTPSGARREVGGGLARGRRQGAEPLVGGRRCRHGGRLPARRVGARAPRAR
jgi:hypothetical protein